jgi:hypothetical protein
MDALETFVIAAAAAAIGGVIAFKYVNKTPVGGAVPVQGTQQVGVMHVPYLPYDAAPVAQIEPITEAAYNIYPTGHHPAFGAYTNQPEQEAVLPY